LSKHRRPTRIQRLGTLATNSPLQLGVAAGVVGTLSVTGTVVASAADSMSTDKARPKTNTAGAAFVLDPTDVSATATQLAVHDAVAQADQDRLAEIAQAKAKARREAAQKRAAERARASRSSSRTFSSVSNHVEHMSASASHVLAIAAQVASGAYYAHGGDGPSGFDCSGFTSYVFSKVGVSLPHSSSAQYGSVQHVSSPQPGDLVFVYNGGGGSIGHVAIYAGGGYWWEAANESVGVGKHRAWSTNVSYGRVL
jgi:cell wall-associated NlpC family hydrolase